MKRLLGTILIIYIMSNISLYGQRVPSRDSVRQKIKTEVNIPDSSSVKKTKQSVKQTVKSEAAAIKSTVKSEVKQTVPDVKKPDVKKVSETGKTKVKEKASNLQYDSDHPENAPWKKDQFSKDDLKDFDIPAVPNKVNVPSVDQNKQKQYADEIDKLKSSSSDQKKLEQSTSELSKSKKLDKGKHLLDSLMEVKGRIDATSVQQELLSAKKVYSEKYIKRLYDSLGIKKGDSLFKVGSALIKSEAPKEELLQRINSPISSKLGKAGISGFDDKTQSFKTADAEKLGSTPLTEKDLSSLKLQQDVLSELEPLKAGLVDSKYMSAIDSMRGVAMKAKRYSLDEKQVTDELKQSIFNKKPSFMDKSYCELILSFVNDTTFSIAQISPSWGYHFTNTLSIGMGPHIAVQYQEKKLNAMVGFRTFVKAEFFKQRAYLQLEDNVGQTRVNNDAIRQTKHSILAGGGAVLPLSKKIGINISVLYRVNQKDVQPGGSPWVVRVGLSSIKSVAQK